MGTIVQKPVQTSQAECWRLWFRIGARLLARDALASLDVLIAWQDRVHQRHLLTQMSDRTLADIGLSRADIQAELDKPFWRS